MLRFLLPKVLDRQASPARRRRDPLTTPPAHRRPAEALERRLLFASATLTNGSGDGSLSLTVDPYGFYNAATYDPMGQALARDTTNFSGLFVSLFEAFLSESTLPELQFTSTTGNEAVSSFNRSGLSVTLTQTVQPADAQGVNFVQAYQITNSTDEPLTLRLVRHVDGDLDFDPGLDDFAGVSPDGKFVFEFDDAANPTAASGLFGITSSGGTHVGYTIQPYRYDDNIVSAGGIPAEHLNQVDRDADGNRLTDSGYDVTVSLQNDLTLAPGQTQTFTTTTRFGQGVPLEVIAPPEELPPPTQDQGFNRIVTDFATEAVGTQSDGKLVMAGHRFTEGVSRAVLARFNTDGTPDTTFGTNGVVDSPAGADDAFYSLAVAPDNSLYASGRSGGDFVIAHFTANGAPDAAFGTAGRTVTNFDDIGGGTDDSAYGLALGPNGTIVVGGGAGGAFAFARYTSTGALDTSFGNGGRRRFDVGISNTAIASVAVQSDGRIIVTGGGGVGGSQVLVTRLLASGEPDLNFANNVIVLAVPGLEARTDLGETDRTQGLAVQGDDKILIANRTPGGDFGIVRLNPNGTLDTTFGTGGLATADFGGDDDADWVNVQGGGSGEILAVGTSATGANAVIAIAAFNPDGTPVTSYGEGGKAVQDPGLTPGRSFRSGQLNRVALGSIQPNTRRLITGASDIEGGTSRSAFGRVLVPGSVNEIALGNFGAVAGQRRPATLTLPNTNLKLSLTGGGSAAAFDDLTRPGMVKLVLVGTTARSALNVKGPGRVTLADVDVDGPLGRFNGKNVDLAGTMFVNGPAGNLSIGNVRGTSALPATVAAAGPIRSLAAFSLENARVLSGANFGANALLGGGDDTFGEGRIQSLKITGPITASFIGAGVNPQNLIYGDPGDTIVGGAASRIDRMNVKGAVDAATVFAAGSFGNIRRLGRERVDVTTDPRFRILT